MNYQIFSIFMRPSFFCLLQGFTVIMFWTFLLPLLFLRCFIIITIIFFIRLRCFWCELKHWMVKWIYSRRKNQTPKKQPNWICVSSTNMITGQRPTYQTWGPWIGKHLAPLWPPQRVPPHEEIWGHSTHPPPRCWTSSVGSDHNG